MTELQRCADLELLGRVEGEADPERANSRSGRRAPERAYRAEAPTSDPAENWLSGTRRPRGFAHLPSSYVQLDERQLRQHRDWGYDIDSWLAGRVLVVNGKFTDLQSAQRNSNK